MAKPAWVKTGAIALHQSGVALVVGGYQNRQIRALPKERDGGVSFPLKECRLATIEDFREPRSLVLEDKIYPVTPTEFGVQVMGVQVRLPSVAERTLEKQVQEFAKFFDGEITLRERL